VRSPWRSDRARRPTSPSRGPGGIGRIEGPIIGTVIFFFLRQMMADFGAFYLLLLGAIAIAVMLKAPKGLWGLVADRFDWQIFPLQRRLVIESTKK
jgi:branched-chain amino acid transport system permease protein